MNIKEMRESTEILMHLLKNPLHGAGINLEVAKSRAGSDRTLMRHLKIVGQEIERIDRVLANYLAYLNMSEEKRAAVGLKKFLSGKRADGV